MGPLSRPDQRSGQWSQLTFDSFQSVSNERSWSKIRENGEFAKKFALAVTGWTSTLWHLILL